MDPIVTQKLDELIANKKKVTVIADELQVSRQTVYKWLSKYKRDNSEIAKALRERSTLSAHNKIPPQIESVVISIAEKNPEDSVSALIVKLESDYKIVLNSATVFRILKRNNIRYQEASALKEQLVEISQEIVPVTETFASTPQVASFAPSVQTMPLPVLSAEPFPVYTGKDVNTRMFEGLYKLTATALAVLTCVLTVTYGATRFESGAIALKQTILYNELSSPAFASYAHILPIREVVELIGIENRTAPATPTFTFIADSPRFKKSISVFSPRTFSLSKLGTATNSFVKNGPRLSVLSSVPLTNYTNYMFGGGVAQAQNKTSDSFSLDTNFSLLDRFSLALFCGVTSFSGEVKQERCNYSKLVSLTETSTEIVPIPSGSVVVDDGAKDQQGGTEASTSTPSEPSPSSPIYLTRYITQYIGVPGPAGRDGTDGKDGVNGISSSIPEGYGSYIIPSYSSPATSIGVSTISYLRQTTIELPVITGGTATTLSLITPMVQGGVFSGHSLFNDSASFTGSVTINNLTATSSTVTNATTTNLFSTNGTFTNLFATNATTTNAYIDVLTVGSSTAGSVTISGTLNVAGTSTLATTTATAFTTTYATTTNLFTQNLSVGNASTTGNQSIDGQFNVSGTSTLGAKVFLNGSVVVGTSTDELFTVNALVNSNITPSQNITYDLGSASFYWRNLYANNINVNSISAASTTISGTSNNDFTLNSDNASSDAESASIVFFRGLTTPNALLRWNATTKRMESNMSFKVQNETPTTGTTTLTVQSGAGQGTTNLLELLNYAGTKLSAFTKDGWLGIGTTTPSTSLHIATSDGLIIPSGTTAQRPVTTLPGIIRYNTTNTGFEGYNGSTWGSLGGVSDVDQNTYISAENSAGANNDELKFYTAGTLRGIVSSTGNFGIGTSTPGSMLSVSSSTANGTSNLFSVSTSTSIFNVLANGNVGIGTTVPNTKLQISSSDPTTYSSDLMAQSPSDVMMLSNGDQTTTGYTGLMFQHKSSSVALARIALTGSFFDSDTAALTFGLRAMSGVGGAIERMRITADGNVGIGTTTPGSLLSVQGSSYFGGNITATGTLSAGVTTATNFATSNGDALVLKWTDGAGGFRNYSLSRDIGTGHLSFTGSQTGSLGYDFDGTLGVTGLTTLTSASTTNITISNNAYFGGNTGVWNGSGNVGIGTTVPALRAEIKGVIGAPATSGTTQTGISRFSQSGGSLVLDVGVRSGPDVAWLQSVDANNLAINYPLILNPNGGNVGIGTTTPTYKLDIAGNINISSGSTYMYNGANVITASTTLNNYFFGNSGNLTMTGLYNTASGVNSIRSNTSGGYNTASGVDSLYFNTTGSNNIASGGSSLFYNTSGGYNTASGGGSLFSNTTGSSNTALGFQTGYGDGSLPNNRSVTDNSMVFLGMYASRDASVASTTAMTNGIAIGYDAKVLASNQVVLGNNSITTTLLKGNVGIGTTTPTYKLDIAGGDLNIASSSKYRINGVIIAQASTTLSNYFFGNSGNLTMTGFNNTGSGINSLYSNTTGFSNTASGMNSLFSNTIGIYNTASGVNSLYSNTTGAYNTAVGYAAGYDVNTATSTGANTFLGYNTGRGITTGVNNTILGANVTGLTAGLSNNIIIADGAGNQRINVGSTGNVGIGTSSPTQKLDVNGIVNATNFYKNGTPFLAGSPANTISSFNQSTCPAGWILADGTSGTPDLRGIYVRGAGTSTAYTNANGSYFASTFGTFQNDAFQGHYHEVSGGPYGSTQPSGGSDSSGGGAAFNNPTATTIITDGTNGTPRTANETRPASYSLTYCMKTTEDANTTSTIWGSSGANVFLQDTSKNLGIGTTSPISVFTVASSTATSTASIFSVASTTTLFNVLANGNVGIGVSPLDYKLQVNGSVKLGGAINIGRSGGNYDSVGYNFRTTNSSDVYNYDLGDFSSRLEFFQGGFYFKSAGSGVAGNAISYTNTFIVERTGNATLAGTLTQNSDERLKDTIASLPSSYGLDSILKLNPVTYTWKDTNRGTSTQIGFLAQEVQKFFPELVTRSSATTTDTPDGTLGLNYIDLIAPTIKALQDINSVFTATNALNASSTVLSFYRGTTTPAITVGATGVLGIGNNGISLGGELLRVSGTVRATGFDIDNASDIAETFPASEAVDAGTIVAFATTTYAWSPTATSTDTYEMSGVRKAHTDYEAIGIISTQPGIRLGGTTANGVPVAFTGRVPVKVTKENGDIKRGDYITVSKTRAGYGMKLTGDGKAIGVALSDDVGRDTVLVLLQVGNHKLDMQGRNATTTAFLTTGNIDLNANGVAIINIKSLASANGTWSIDENGKIVAKMLCLDEVCIDKSALSSILSSFGQSGIVAGTSTTTVPDTDTATTTEETMVPEDVPVIGIDEIGTATTTEELSTASTTPSTTATTTDPVVTPTPTEPAPTPEPVPTPEPTLEPMPTPVEPTPTTP